MSSVEARVGDETELVRAMGSPERLKRWWRGPNDGHLWGDDQRCQLLWGAAGEGRASLVDSVEMLLSSPSSAPRPVSPCSRGV